MTHAAISAAGDLIAAPSNTPDAAHLLRLSVLNDICNGRIYRLPNGVFLADDDTESTQTSDRGACIAEIQRLIGASWVMECTGMHRYDRDGLGVRLRLTTLGEVRRDELERSLAVAP